MLFMEFIKIYYLGVERKWFEEKLVELSAAKILDSRSQAAIGKIVKGAAMEIEADDREKKDKVLEIKKRKLEEMRKKQKNFNDKMNIKQASLEFEEETEVERCVFCHEPIKTSLTIYCCDISTSNLYSSSQLRALAESPSLC